MICLMNSSVISIVSVLSICWLIFNHALNGKKEMIHLKQPNFFIELNPLIISYVLAMEIQDWKKNIELIKQQILR